ncbi:MAG: MarR family transcriptional regulator [Mycobacterium sp.]|nr:MAG: MarR family transcriptional regulator [Mycobacterium sp.]
MTELAATLGMSNQNVVAALGRLIRQGWVKRGKPDDGDQRDHPLLDRRSSVAHTSSLPGRPDRHRTVQ